MSTELALASIIFVSIGLIIASVFVLSKYVGPRNETSEIKDSVYEVVLQTQLAIQMLDFQWSFT